jgi:hypothetical protein
MHSQNNKRLISINIQKEYNETHELQCGGKSAAQICTPRYAGRDEPDAGAGRIRTPNAHEQGVFLGRGLYQAVMYPEAVHFRDKNSGKLEEIDNTLMPIQDSACGVYLTNRNNDELKVEFHGAQDVQPKVVDFARPQESKRDRRRAVLAQLDGEVVYEDIFPDVNLNCAVQALLFKDSFTFKTPESVRKLSFLLFTPEMQAEKQADDSIQVTAADGRTAFLLPRPFLQSAEAEDEIGGVQVDMAATVEPFTWRVTYTPDEKWLQKAKFPVVLDPPVITKNHSSAMEDNFVSSKKADEVQSYGATGMTVSYNSGNWGTSRSFIDTISCIRLHHLLAPFPRCRPLIPLSVALLRCVPFALDSVKNSRRILVHSHLEIV